MEAAAPGAAPAAGSRSGVDLETRLIVRFRQFPRKPSRPSRQVPVSRLLEPDFTYGRDYRLCLVEFAACPTKLDSTASA